MQPNTVATLPDTELLGEPGCYVPAHPVGAAADHRDTRLPLDSHILHVRAHGDARFARTRRGTRDTGQVHRCDHVQGPLTNTEAEGKSDAEALPLGRARQRN